MKRIITIVFLLVSSLSYGQIRYNQMPDLDSLAVGDYVPIFRPPYDQGKATFSTLIDLIGAGTGVDSIWRVTGKDSIFYLKGGITYKIKDSVGTGGGGATWGAITGALEDQADLYDTLFNRVKYADTSSMLLPYLRKVDTVSLSNRINLKLNAADTSSLSSRINTKLNSSDTASLSSRINLKVNISDTATMLTPYATDAQVNVKLNATDTASLSSRINLKVNISDTATMLTPYATDAQVNVKLNASDTSSLSTRINTKITDSTWKDWASSVSITGLTSLTTKQAQYVVIGKTMFMFIDFRCASPNGTGTTVSFNIPFNASSWAGEQRGLIHGVNSTTQGPCLWKITGGTATVDVAIGANDTAFSSWTNGTARRIEGFIMININ